MDKITPKHLTFLILGVSIVSLKTYPRVFLENGQRDTWIAVIISSIVIFAFLIFIMSVWKQSSEKNMVKLYQIALGKRLGNFFVFLFAITLFITLIECTTVEADSMHQNMLLETPKWFFALFFVLPCIYVVSRELVSIVTVTIIGIILIMIAGINLGILTAPNKEYEMLLPILEGGITQGFLIAIVETLGLYGCVSIVLPYLSKVQAKNNKVIRYVVIALIILIQMEIISIIGILTTFNAERAIAMNYPKLLQTQLVSYMQVLDFGELYVMLQILGGWLLKYVITFYGILIIMRNYNISRKHMNYAIILISALVYLGTWLAGKDSLILFKLLNIYPYICLFNFVMVPLVVFSIIKMKMRKKKGKLL